MELISPITAQGCVPYIGKPVCAVLHDGSYVYGYIDRVDGGKLYLNSYAPGVGTVASTPSKAKKQLKSKAQKAQTSFFNPFLGAGLFALDLALIALLFAVPFFWI